MNPGVLNDKCNIKYIGQQFTEINSLLVIEFSGIMEGYAKLASFMGLHDEYAIYRRFRQLNAQNLLYLQAELTHLERELRNLAQRDSSVPEREFFAKDWWSLSQTENDNDAEQWEKVLEIRQKLEEYSLCSI
jgi:hypothetical protein